MKQILKSVAIVAMVTSATFVSTASMMVATSGDAEARGFSSRSSFSRSSFRSSSSSWKSSSSKSSSSFWGKSKSSSSSKKFSSSNKKSSSVKTSSKKKSSMTSPAQSKRTKQVLTAKRQQGQFKKPATVPGIKTSNGKRPSRVAANKAYRDTYKSNPVYSKARSYDSRTYWDRRDRYYSGYSTPTYVYNSSPSFGMWDTIFLYSLLNDNNNAGSFAHHHQNDADYRAWRSEADNLAKDNAELRAQLAAMDKEAAKMAGTPMSADYLPKGVDADIALAQGARQSVLPTINFCTGGKTGAYFRTAAGVLAPNVSDVNIVPINTQGAVQNLQFISEGKCDMAYVQGDVYWNYVEDNKTTDLPFKRVFTPYRESVHLFCHEDGPNEISDLGSDNKVWFPKGSGAAATWRNFIGENEDYASVQTVLTNSSMTVSSNAEALMKVTENKNDCMMYVAAAGATEFLRQANAGAKGSKIVLIDIDDGSLDNTEDPSGADVYDFTQFDEKLYGNLTRQAGVVWGGGDIDTLTVAADVIVSTKWVDSNKTLYPSVQMQMTGLTDRIQRVVMPINN